MAYRRTSGDDREAYSALERIFYVDFFVHETKRCDRWSKTLERTFVTEETDSPDALRRYLNGYGK